MDNPQRQWLHHAAHTHYARHLPDRVFHDVDVLLSRYATCLFPKLDTYVHPDGVTSRILCIYGTVPVAFSGASYNIPVEIWIPEPYPSSAPLVYVRPTQAWPSTRQRTWMPTGACFIPSYTTGTIAVRARWRRGAIQHAFSLDPPVYAKPPAGSTPAPTT
ncbi:UEV domain-domain-containing protein, partial [Catenaria anguillulae PL171]